MAYEYQKAIKVGTLSSGERAGVRANNYPIRNNLPLDWREGVRASKSVQHGNPLLGGEGRVRADNHPIHNNL